MRQIPLTQGRVALVDDEDYDRLIQRKWRVQTYRGHNHTDYAVRWTLGGKNERTLESMHRIILNIPKGLECDHIDGNGLNNQRSNLRIVTTRENQHNQKFRVKKKTSKFPGVSWTPCKKPWKATIQVDGKKRHLGLFITEEEAFHAYKKAIDELDKKLTEDR